MRKIKKEYISDIETARDKLLDYAKESRMKLHDIIYSDRKLINSTEKNLNTKIKSIFEFTDTFVDEFLKQYDEDVTSLKDFKKGSTDLIRSYDKGKDGYKSFNKPRNHEHMRIIQTLNGAWMVLSLILFPIAVLTYRHNKTESRKASGGKYGVCNLGLFNERTRSSTLANALLYQIKQPVEDNQQSAPENPNANNKL